MIARFHIVCDFLLLLFYLGDLRLVLGCRVGLSFDVGLAV
jgi:hypothetical protein